MTKAELLRVLDKFPMNARVVFQTHDDEYRPTHAYQGMGLHGLVCILTEGSVPPVEQEPEQVLP
jgi:hypothetical protein